MPLHAPQMTLKAQTVAVQTIVPTVQPAGGVAGFHTQFVPPVQVIEPALHLLGGQDQAGKLQE